jgi:hypothetical protein
MARYVLFTVATVSCSIFLLAQPPQPPEKKDPQSAVEPRSAPGEGQKYLAQFVGTWSVEKLFHPKEGDPVKTTGECTQVLTHGGRFLRSEFTFDTPSGPSTGTGVIGFEPATGLFTSIWYDSRSTRMSHRKSKEKFDGKEIVLFAAALDGAEARQSRTVTRVEDDGKKIVHKQYNPSPDGKERLLIELVLTKKKAQSK